MVNSSIRRPLSRLLWQEPLILTSFFVLVLVSFFVGDTVVGEFITDHSAYRLAHHAGNFSVIQSVLFKTMVLHFCFFLMHFVFINLMRPPKWIYSGLFLLYSYCFVVVYYPQLLTDFPEFGASLVFFSRNLGPLAVKIIGACFVATLAFFGIRNGTNKMVVSFLCVGLAAWIFYFNDPMRTFNEELSGNLIHRSSANPDLIFIGIDGLKPGSLDSYKKDPTHPYLSRFLNEAQTFSRVVSPIGRTLPSLAAILSGSNPVEDQLRSSFQEGSYDSDYFLRDGVLSKLKSLGYETTIGLSDSTYVQFKTGKVIDTVIGPKAGFQNYLIPYYDRDHLLFAWCNNSIGLKIFPEIFADSAFSDTWWPQIFRHQVIKNLQEMDRNPAPQFKLYHISKPHWPGSNQYPYYHVRKDSPYIDSLFGYSRSRRIQMGSSAASDILENKAVYEEGVRQMVDNYLEGVLKALYQSKLTETAVVGLYSDHGEAFFDPSLLPISKNPRHGSTLIYGDDSDLSYFAIRGPTEKVPDQMVEKPLELTDIVKIAGLLGKLDLHFEFHADISSETDRWVNLTVPGQIVSAKVMLDDIVVDDEGIPFVQSDPKGYLTKEVAVYDDQYRLTLYFTRYGYQLYLEPSGKNQGNFLALNRERVNSLFAKLKKVFRPDFFSHRLPALSIDWSRQDPFILRWEDSSEKLLSQFRQNPEIWAWQVYMRSKSLYFYDFDLNESSRLLKELLADKRSDPEIRLRSENDLYRMTAYTGIDFLSDVPALLHEVRAKDWPVSLAREWNLFRLLAMQRLKRNQEARSLFESAVRDFGSRFVQLQNFPNSLFLGLVEHDAYFNIPTRMWTLYHFSLHHPQTVPLSEVDTMLIQLHTFELAKGFPEKTLIFNELSKSFKDQFKYQMYGINDEWYLSSIMNEPIHGNWFSRIFLLAMEDPFLNFETMALLEQKNEDVSKVTDIGILLGQEDLNAVDKRKVYQALLLMKFGRMYGAPPATVQKAGEQVDYFKNKMKTYAMRDLIRSLAVQRGSEEIK